MGLLDDAIREHLDLKRRRGADPDEVAREENEALGPPRTGEFAAPAPEPAPEDTAEEPAAVAASELDESAWLDEPEEGPAAPLDQATTEFAPPGGAEPEEPPAAGEDVLEETPDFLQETPEHDRLWFEQRPPRDFDFDK